MATTKASDASFGASIFDPSALEPLDLTHVLHDPNDPLGVLFALSALVPIFVIVGYATAIVARREIALCTALVGQLANEAANAVLKRIFAESRPNPNVGTGHGMPSSHSQFMAFLATYFTLYCLDRLDYDRPWIWKPLLIAGLYAVAIAVAGGRVYLSYHTSLQVIVGFFCGAALALVFHLFVERVLRPFLYPRILNSALAKFILLRDSSHVPNVFKKEWDWYEAERIAASKSSKPGRRKAD
ncbi:hypothetical protein DFJ74DRAFT_687699 [Hyaloraphidium curvatum]|nr:hypothetical protein DFJ74DRAFT_687699 [Hyaloraphidium curvatum]